MDYVSYKVVSNNDNLTVTWPTWPVKSWSNNIYTWNVKWTLKENHVLTLEVETKVNKMPKSEDDYLNIACVIDDGKIDCDDDEPPVVSWKLNIVKTIVWSKEIKNTWDIVTWNIRVTAESGNVTNFTITDKMPSILWYKDSFVLHNPWLTIWTPVVSWNEVSWKVTWTLEKWEYVEIQLTTYAKVMPDQDYDNVACVKYVGEDGKEIEDCDDEPLPAPHIWIKKHFTDWTKEKTVKIWDLIWYRIDFGNTGNASATVTSIKDFLPKNVWYISSEIFVNWEKIHTNETQKWDMDLFKWFKVVDGVYIDIYGWITLTPNSTWYIILTWRVLGEYTWNRTNFACIYLNDKKVDCDDAIHTIDTSEVMCKSNIKLEDSANPCIWDSWTVDVTCNADWGIANTIEILCDWNVQTGWTNKSEIKWSCTFSSDWNHSVQCKVNWSTKAVTWSVCEWTYKLSHHSCSSSCFIAWTKVTMADGSVKNIEDVRIGEKVLWANGSSNVVIWFHRPLLWEKALWSINGWEYFVTAEHPFMTTEWWKSLNPELSMLWTNIQVWLLEVWDELITENWNIKVVSLTSRSWDSNTQLYNFKLDWDHTYHANGYLVHNKWWVTPPTKDYPPVWSASCFNINAWNFSIEKWEILPFYWNLEKLGDKDNYTEYKVNTYKYRDAIDNYTNYFNGNKSCEEDEYWKIATNSMVCTFKIYNGWKYGINNPLYEIEWPCLSTENAVINSSLVNDWLKHMTKEKYNWYFVTDVWNDWAYTFKASMYYIDKFWEKDTSIYLDGDKYKLNKKPNADITEFWEYKLTLSEIKFLQCGLSNNDKLERVQEKGWWCEGNLATTTSYTVQKTPSGNLKASTITLDSFLDMDWTKLSWLLNAIASSEYESNPQTDKAMADFINKYEKLAVSVGDGSMKKVPWKNIYFVNTDHTIINWNYSKPVTFVQTNPDATITVKWNVTNLNMMVLSKWKIKFVDPDNCRNRQVVKWIFYAAKWIERMKVTKNTSLANPKRCTEWWLTVKWVLIGRWLDQMMKNSRSNLNYWFDETGGKGGKNAKTVMNWASVLIEYSPSVFTKSTMPPGAEDFTTALSIYKQ